MIFIRITHLNYNEYNSNKTHQSCYMIIEMVDCATCRINIKTEIAILQESRKSVCQREQATANKSQAKANKRNPKASKNQLKASPKASNTTNRNNQKVIRKHTK